MPSVGEVLAEHLGLDRVGEDLASGRRRRSHRCRRECRSRRPRRSTPRYAAARSSKSLHRDLLAVDRRRRLVTDEQEDSRDDGGEAAGGQDEASSHGVARLSIDTVPAPPAG